MNHIEAAKREMLRDARRAIEENARHSKDSLFMLLFRWWPQASEDLLDEVVEEVL